MRILFLTRRFYPEVGGVEKHCYELARRLVKQGHQVSVITEEKRGKIYNKRSNYQSIVQSDKQRINSKRGVKSSYFEYELFENIKIFRFDFGKENWFKKFVIWSELLRQRDVFKYSDIIHCHDVFFWYLPFKVLYPRKKVFTTFHGYEGYPIKIKNIIVRKISEFFSSGTICVGEFMRKWYFANPDFVIYGGVNSNRLWNSSHTLKYAKGGIKKDIISGGSYRKESKKTALIIRKGALFIGRLDEQTNIREYCRAVRIIRKKVSNFRFDIAGDGKYRKLAQKDGRVLGFIDNPEEKLGKYQFAFVSRYLAIIEALAQKIPVFAFYDDPLKEDYLRMTPFARYIKIVNKPSDLASIVQLFYSSKKPQQDNIEAGFKWARKQSWEEVLSIYQELWQS